MQTDILTDDTNYLERKRETCRRPVSSTREPTTFGSARNHWRQADSDNNAMREVPMLSSPLLKTRPSSGFTPRSEKKSALTTCAWTSSCNPSRRDKRVLRHTIT